MLSLPVSLLLLALLRCTFAATAEEWRGRSIYQIITDRYALPSGAVQRPCDSNARTWCGGTWNGIRENLDYIQNAGFTAIWISPVSQNYEGITTVYGDAYHGYWASDITKLNSRFGTASDLKALSAELHRRKMYLMVDVVVNNVMSTSTRPDYSQFMFKDASLYHPYCPLQYGNLTSEQQCWLGDQNVTLPDLDTTNPTVISRYGDWVENLVKEYDIDGLRIDAAKYVNKDFWPRFCAKAGVFCMGEVFGGIEIDPIAEYQGADALDSVLNFPLYTALTETFHLPGPQNVSALVDVLEQSKTKFTDVGLLGNFLENHDVPRWHNMSVDPQSLYNALVFTFLSDGIPIVYYGLEHGFSGPGNPYNREALWPTGYVETPAYKLIASLNQLRNYMIDKTNWLHEETQILTASQHGIAIMKGSVIFVVTNIGSPPQNGTQIALNTPYESSFATTNIMTCEQWVVGSKGMLDVEYTKGGTAVILVPSDELNESGICNTHAPIRPADISSAQPGFRQPIQVLTALLLSTVLVLGSLGI